LCKAKIGEFETRVRKAGIPFAEIVCVLLYIARKVLRALDASNSRAGLTGLS
jgi:hypothetical protein